jgi:hypothetical protein
MWTDGHRAGERALNALAAALLAATLLLVGADLLRRERTIAACLDRACAREAPAALCACEPPEHPARAVLARAE